MVTAMVRIAAMMVAIIAGTASANAPAMRRIRMRFLLETMTTREF